MDRIRKLYSHKITTDPRLDLLFKEYYDRLVFFSWQIIKDKQQSEDIAQDAFIAYWQQRAQIASHPVAVKNFLYSSVKNACLNVLRHARVADQFQNSFPGTEPAEEYILEAIISAEIITEVNLAIKSLPPHLIKLTRLSFLEGKKNHEVAKELEMSVNTVKKQKQRALELLKLSLHPELIILLVSYGTYFTRN